MAENPFDRFVPTTREFTAGVWPVKSFQAQNGASVKILYGDRIAQKTMSLSYANLNDKDAEIFFQHYWEQKGTYGSFKFNDTSSDDIRGGWQGDLTTIASDGTENGRVKWSYAEEPRIVSTFKGRSTVTVELIGTSSY